MLHPHIWCRLWLDPTSSLNLLWLSEAPLLIEEPAFGGVDFTLHPFSSHDMVSELFEQVYYVRPHQIILAFPVSLGGHKVRLLLMHA